VPSWVFSGLVRVLWANHGSSRWPRALPRRLRAGRVGCNCFRPSPSLLRMVGEDAFSNRTSNSQPTAAAVISINKTEGSKPILNKNAMFFVVTRKPFWEDDCKLETRNIAFPCTSFWRLRIPRFHSVLSSRRKRSTNGAQISSP